MKASKEVRRFSGCLLHETSKSTKTDVQVRNTEYAVMDGTTTVSVLD